MSVFIWASRHALTSAQKACFRLIGYEDLVILQCPITFGHDPVSQIREIEPVGTSEWPWSVFRSSEGECDCERPLIGVVGPAAVVLELLRAGYAVAEFRNTPSARTKGVFLCEGMYVHTLSASVWYPCPIPLNEQEQGDELVPVK